MTANSFSTSVTPFENTKCVLKRSSNVSTDNFSLLTKLESAFQKIISHLQTMLTETKSFTICNYL